MRILALSDEVVPYVYSPTVRERSGKVDLIVGCGDLPAAYLEYVVSQLDVALVYVPGNHDADDYRVPGGQSVDGRLTRVAGLTVMGFGGSRRYKPDGRHQYTELEMQARVLRHAPRLLLRRAAAGRGADLLVTHAPPFGVHDGADPAHIGFQAFRRLIGWARPRIMLHGHAHARPNLATRETVLHGCRIVNVFPVRTLDLPEAG